MPTMDVSLTPELAAFVEREVGFGDFSAASEVVGAALRLLRRERELRAERLAVLRREVMLGVEQADRGDFSSRSIEEIADAVRREG